MKIIMRWNDQILSCLVYTDNFASSLSGQTSFGVQSACESSFWFGFIKGGGVYITGKA